MSALCYDLSIPASTQMIDGTEKPKIPSKFAKLATRYNEFDSKTTVTYSLPRSLSPSIVRRKVDLLFLFQVIANYIIDSLQVKSKSASLVAGCHRYAIELYNTNTEHDVIISHEMVATGHARTSAEGNKVCV